MSHFWAVAYRCIFAQLHEVNLAHLREHGARLLAFAPASADSNARRR